MHLVASAGTTVLCITPGRKFGLNRPTVASIQRHQQELANTKSDLRAESWDKHELRRGPVSGWLCGELA